MMKGEAGGKAGEKRGVDSILVCILPTLMLDV